MTKLNNNNNNNNNNQVKKLKMQIKNLIIKQKKGI